MPAQKQGTTTPALTRRGLEGEQAPSVQPRKCTADERRPELRSSRPPVAHGVADDDGGVGEGEERRFQRLARLQRSAGPGEASPELRERVGFELHAHVVEAVSVDALEYSGGGANGAGEAILDARVVAAWGNHEYQRGQARELRC